MDILLTIAKLIDAGLSIASDAFDKTFPPDGIDPIDKKLNGNDEEFESLDGINYRTHYLTRISSFIGLPNRKLYKSKGQSLQNLWDNFLGKQDNASNKKLIRRAAIMVPLNFLSLLLKFPRNILKFVIELIPLACSVILWDAHNSIISKTSFFTGSSKFHPAITYSIAILLYLLAGIMRMASWVFQYIYLTDRCLLDPYDSFRDAWQYGMQFGKLFAYFFSAISIFATIVMFCIALPIAAKLFATWAGPTIMHYLPVVIDHALINFANIITPTLTAIGHGFTFAIDTVLVLNLPLATTANIIYSIPALVGGSLFFATAIATIGLALNGYINAFKAWWNFNPEFAKPINGEGAPSVVLGQQFDMLCALGEKNLIKTSPAPESGLPPANSFALPVVPQDVAVPVTESTSTLPTESLRTQNSADVSLKAAASKKQNHEEDRSEEEKRSDVSLGK